MFRERTVGHNEGGLGVKLILSLSLTLPYLTPFHLLDIGVRVGLLSMCISMRLCPIRDERKEKTREMKGGGRGGVAT